MTVVQNPLSVWATSTAEAVFRWDVLASWEEQCYITLDRSNWGQTDSTVASYKDSLHRNRKCTMSCKHEATIFSKLRDVMVWLHESLLFQKSFRGTHTCKHSVTQGLRNPTADELHRLLVKARVSPAGATGTGSLSVKSQLEALLTQRRGSEERTADSAGNLGALGVQSWL